MSLHLFTGQNSPKGLYQSVSKYEILVLATAFYPLSLSYSLRALKRIKKLRPEVKCSFGTDETGNTHPGLFGSMTHSRSHDHLNTFYVDHQVHGRRWILEIRT